MVIGIGLGKVKSMASLRAFLGVSVLASEKGIIGFGIFKDSSCLCLKLEVEGGGEQLWVKKERGLYSDWQRSH